MHFIWEKRHSIGAETHSEGWSEPVVNQVEKFEKSKTRKSFRVKTVGICGSDVHFCLHGAIGNFIVKEPMVNEIFFSILNKNAKF